MNFCLLLGLGCCLGVQITDDGGSLYIGSFCPAMTSLSSYLEEAAFTISISGIMLKNEIKSYLRIGKGFEKSYVPLHGDREVKDCKTHHCVINECPPGHYEVVIIYVISNLF